MGGTGTGHSWQAPAGWPAWRGRERYSGNPYFRILGTASSVCVDSNRSLGTGSNGGGGIRRTARPLVSKHLACHMRPEAGSRPGTSSQAS